MDNTLTINFDKAIRSAQILDDSGKLSSCVPELPQKGGSLPLSPVTSDSTEEDRWKIKNEIQNLQKQKAEFAQSCQTLGSLINKLNQFYDELFAGHREEIAKLSVEIANKILMQKAQKGDYKIESIINEALKNAPAHQDVVVHLNPDDMSQLQKLSQHDPSNTLADIKFVADPAIGRAECLLETPKGIIKSFIKEHIERISDALAKAG